MSNDEVYQSAADNCRTISGLLENVRLAAKELRDRAHESASEALDAGGVNDSWAMEVDRLTHLLDQTSNYIASHESRPQWVQFENGRVVEILHDEHGAYLDVSFVPKVTPELTPAEKAALDSLPPDFIERLLAGESGNR